jgi:DNA-binding XRE family transcriptional regulator
MSTLADAMRLSDLPPKALAAQAGVSVRQVALGRTGKPIGAGVYLALCGAVGVDPVDGTRRPVKSVSAAIAWWLLSAALYITRRLRQLDQRSAAKVIGVSPATVCRVESGKPVSIAALIKVSAFIGVHPDGYTVPAAACTRATVSRVTLTETRCSDLRIDRGHSVSVVQPS